MVIKMGNNWSWSNNCSQTNDDKDSSKWSMGDDFEIKKGDHQRSIIYSSNYT